MTAIERYKEELRHDREATARANRIALEYALQEDLPPDVYSEMEFEFSDDGRAATLNVAGCVPIRARMYIHPDGVGWYLKFTVVNEQRVRIVETFPLALEAASITD